MKVELVTDLRVDQDQWGQGRGGLHLLVGES